MDNLPKLLSMLSPSAKALFLAQAIHEATANARLSYFKIPDFEHPNPNILKDVNDFVHRMSGFIKDVLVGKEWAPADVIIEMIQEHFRKAGAAPPFAKWLKLP